MHPNKGVTEHAHTTRYVPVQDKHRPFMGLKDTLGFYNPHWPYLYHKEITFGKPVKGGKHHGLRTCFILPGPTNSRIKLENVMSFINPKVHVFLYDTIIIGNHVSVTNSNE